MEIWSGGQTGVDRAALDAALKLGIPTGGWVPLGRLDENGTIPERYDTLREAPTADWSQRTLLNVRDTDATLILTWGAPTGGTLETAEFAKREKRPLLVVDLAKEEAWNAVQVITDWLRENPAVSRLNVAGPRASKAPMVHQTALGVLEFALAQWTGAGGDPETEHQ